MIQIINKTFDALKRGREFLVHDIWHIGRPGEKIPHGYIIKHIRAIILLLQSLVGDMLLLRASALAFTSTLALVPAIAIVFFIVDRFDLGEMTYQHVENRLREWAENAHPLLPSQPNVNEKNRRNITISPGQPVQQSSIESHNQSLSTPDHRKDNENKKLVRSLVGWVFRDVAQRNEFRGKKLQNPIEVLISWVDSNANSQTIGLTGIAFVLATVMGLMYNIESAFNAIWGVKSTRSWFRRLADYFLLLLFLPVAAAVVLGVTAALESEAIRNRVGNLSFLLRSVQYIIVWFTFASLYFAVPNTRVRFRYAMGAGIIAGTLWIAASWIYVKSQVGLANYSFLYSSFAQFPMLLMWIYTGWCIVLFGAELSFSYQNEKTFAMEKLAKDTSYAYREALALRVMIEVAYRFDKGLPNISVEKVAQQWNVPTRLLNEILDKLEQHGLLQACATEPVTYQPARSITRITLAEIIRAIRESGHDPSDLKKDAVLSVLLQEIDMTKKETLNKDLNTVLTQLNDDMFPDIDEIV